MDYYNMDVLFCPSCGEEMVSWYDSIYECEECGAMVDEDIFMDEEEHHDYL